MAGLLERILATSGNAGFMPTPSAGFGAPPPAALSPEEEWQKIQEAEALARAAADRRNVAGMTRAPITNPSQPVVPDAQSAGIQLAMDQAPAGTGVPFSTQAGMLPPITLGQDQAETPIPPGQVPLPMARPTNLEGDEVGARSRTPTAAPPVQIAPQAPPAAAPVAPQAGMGPATPSILDRISNTLGDNSNTLLALGAGFAGAPNFGQAVSRSAAAAIPARAADISQSLARAGRGTTTRALIEAGVPVQQAISAQYDPDLKKSLIKNYIDDRAKKIVEIGQDPNTGAKIFATHDPFTNKLEVIDPSKVQGGGAALSTAAADTDVTGPDYVQKLRETNPDRARQVEAVLAGDKPLPTGKAAQTPIGAALIRDVFRAEPGVSESDFKIRQGVRTDYSSGLASRLTKSLNTTVQHGAGLEKAITDLNNFSFAPGILNPATGMIQKQYDPKYQAARKEFDANKEIFVKELDFVLSGGKPTVSGRKDIQGMFSVDASPEENRASLHKAMDMLNGRLESHAEGYNKGMRTQRQGVDFIDPVNRKNFARLLNGEGGGAATAAPAAGAPSVPKVPVGKSVVIQTPNGPVTIRKVSE